ncbi:type I restriction-modification system subunit M [Endozoicomonas numazuensis]|uniref:site-specific DNA-methyltransferase (adenine-specific) n=1 Tax=Endozoicomonas numazuensis TaxID=1137799 RepID=A0A081NJ49_9GAMM|nr:type I restriction-modification system subunit M [Endozoicomonas numazuensis]KEQ18472.1 type I restriction-modification protein subunit M [Endozoicomonas numazuensis]
MAIKKTELYSSLWQSCDELRGGMDASQYKDYVLTMLFMKYVSDKADNDSDFLLEVPEGGSFTDMVALKGDKEIGDKINKIIGALAQENDLKGVIDVADFNDEDKLGKGKEMQDRLSKLVGIFQGLDLGANQAQGDDLLGDAYEFLMRHFATESGKSKGQFYTPSEVSQILAKVVGITKDTAQDQTVYDPTCGSGSLLLKAADQASRGLTIYGQEMDNATSALARMNMILHDNVEAEIWQDNTLSSPQWKEADGSLKRFDFSVANPPFSFKAWNTGLNPADDEFGRFEYGIPPEKNGDYAFLLHIIKSLKSTGKGAVILPHGVLFRGNVESSIRQNLIKQGYIKGIIGLPANLFYGTGIPACIIVIDKAQASSRSGIFMVDASKGFMKDGNKNRLRAQDIHKIVDIFTRQTTLPGYARMVNYREIEDNDYNLNIPRYIDSTDIEDLHDLTAHMRGGIPERDIDALGSFWKVFPNLRSTLFKPSDLKGYSDACIEAAQVKTTILAHQEFKTFSTRALTVYEQWEAEHLSRLESLTVGDDAKALIHTLSEDLLTRFTQADLLDKYDIYQLLMEYWEETLQDDVYVITQDGWKAGNVLRTLKVAKGEKLKETPDLVINKVKYKSDLIPPHLIIARYFADEQQAVNELQAKKDEATQAVETYIEENSSSGSGGGEDGLLEEAKNDKEKVTKATVTARLKALKNALSGDGEIAALKKCQSLFNKEAAANKAVKGAQTQLDQAVYDKYPELDINQIKELVIEDKWLATIKGDIEAEVERVTQQLANRVKTLEERYAEPLPELTKTVSDLAGKVDEHLKKMGVSW